MLFRPRGVASPTKSASSSNALSIATMLSYRDTWKGDEKDAYSVHQFLELIHRERNKKVEPTVLIMSDKGFKVKDKADMDKAEIAVRKVQSVLNKLTEKNFDSVAPELIFPEMFEEGVIAKVVDRIYEKALSEPVFAGLYANLCSFIAEHEKDIKPGSAKTSSHDSSMRSAVLGRCQALFEEKLEKSGSNDDAMERFRKRQIGNIKFVGELYMHDVLGRGIMSTIIAEKMKVQNPNDVDAEVMMQLLQVIGKRFDAEADKKSLDLLWPYIKNCTENRAFSNRIRFLFINLLEWREKGFPEKEVHEEEETATTATSSVAQGSSSQQQASASPAISNPYGFSAPTQQRGGAAAPAQPSAAPEEDGPKELSDLSPEDQKRALEAMPPQSVTDSVKGIIVSSARDAAVEGDAADWSAAKEQLSTILPGEDVSTCMAASAYALMSKVIVEPKEETQAIFLNFLEAPIWEPSDVCRGFAWCLTEAIANRVVEDIPRAYTRFVDSVCRYPNLPFAQISGEVFATTASNLDAIYCLNELVDDWEIDIISVWEKFLEQWKQKGKPTEPTAVIMNAVGARMQTDFVHSIFPDFVSEMVKRDICLNEELQTWCNGNATNPIYRQTADVVAGTFA